jgi:hypothetical protein
LVVRDGKKFCLDEEGNCFSADEKQEPIGRIEDFEEESPTKEEMDRVIAEMRRKYNLLPGGKEDGEEDIQPLNSEEI